MGPPLILLLFGFSILNGVLAVPANYAQTDHDIYKAENCVPMTPQKEEQVTSIVAKLSEYLYKLTLEYDDLDIRLIKILVERHSENETEEKETQVQLVVNDCAFPEDVVELIDTSAFIPQSNKPDEVASTNDGQSTAETEGQDSETNSNQSEVRQSEAKKTSHSEVNLSNTEKTEVSTTKESESRIDSKTRNDHKKTTVIKNASKEFNNKNKEVISSEKQSESSSVFENKELADDSVLIVENSDDVTSDVNDSSVEYSGKAPQVMLLDLDDTGNKLVELYEEKHGNVPLLLYVRKVLDNLQYLFLN